MLRFIIIAFLFASSLNASKTNKQAGIYIIIRDLKDEKYIKRLKLICEKHNIDLKLIYDLKDR